MTIHKSSTGSGDLGSIVAAFSTTAHALDDKAPFFPAHHQPQGDIPAEQITFEVMQAASLVTQGHLANELHRTANGQRDPSYWDLPQRPKFCPQLSDGEAL